MQNYTKMQKLVFKFAGLLLVPILSVSSFSSVAHAASAPSPVAEAHVTGKTSSSVSLAWTPPSSTDLPIVDYLVEYLPTQGSWISFSHAPSPSTSIEVSGLLFNTPYEFRVSVVQSDGQISTPVVAAYRLTSSGTGRASGGAVYSCGLSQDSSVQCWGSNTNFYGSAGMLGNGTTTNSDIPVLALMPEKATTLSVGANGSCAIGISGQVYCWGHIFGLFSAYGSSLVPTAQPGITNAIKVSSGTAGQYNDISTACAVDSNHQAICWGWGTSGQLGAGNNYNVVLVGQYANPQFLTPVSAPAGIGYVDVVTSGLSTCLIGTDTDVYCAGDNSNSQLGIGLPTTPTLVPTQVTLADGRPLSGVTKIYMSAATTCATVGSDNYCWGAIPGLGSFYHPQLVGALPNGISEIPVVDPWVDTLNVDAPSNLAISSSSGSVGTVITVTGSNLSAVTQLQFGNQNVAFSNNSGALSFSVPSWATIGSVYSITLTSAGGSSVLPNAFTVTQSPIVTVNLSVSTLQTGSQLPVTGGSYTWLSQGRFSPSSPTLGDSSGNVVLTNVVSGPGQIILSGGQLPDGTTVSGSWNVNLLSGALSLQANPPTPPSLITSSANVAFPDGMPVPGAVLTASGLSGSYSDSNGSFSLTYYLPSAITSALSDSNGLAILYGYQSSPAVLGTATYNDTVLVQSTQPIPLTPNGAAAQINFDYAPFLTTSTPALSSVAGSPASLTFTDLNNTSPVVGQSVTLTELSVSTPMAAGTRISTPKGAAAPNCPTTFSGVTDALGNVSIPLCTNVAGLHTYKVTSLGSISQNSTVSMNVTSPVVATTFGLTGPNSGIVNQSSGNFTVTPDGLYTGTVIINVSGGGMNNSIPLNFSNSAVPQTFTITPIATGAVTLSVSSSPSLSNPANLTYLVNPAPASTFSFSGPTSGSQNATSTNFTIAPNGVYSGTISIAVSGAGLNTTIPLTFNNSAASQSFTITPISSGTVILTPTSSPKIANPASRSYSVSPAGLTPILTVTNVGSTGFTVNVTNYSALFKFRATSSAGSIVTGTPNGSNQAFSVTGLVPGQTVTVTVTSTRNGYSTVSASIGATSISAPSAPSAPTGVSGNGQVTISWLAPANNGVPIDSYTVTQSTSLTGPFTAASASCTNINALTCTATGLTNGAAYYFVVSAHNSVGWSALSAASSALTPVAPATTPGTPAAPTGVAGNALVTLTITAPASTGGSAITGYKITQSTTSAGTYSAVAAGTCTTITAAGSCTVTGLTNASTYYFKVAAVNAIGTGSASAASAALTPVAPYTIASGSASPTSASVPVGYSATATRTTITLARAGGSGTNPTTTISVASGTWTVASGTGITVSKTSVSSGSPVTVTLTAATGTLTLNLNSGSAAATYTATVNTSTPISYSVKVA